MGKLCVLGARIIAGLGTLILISEAYMLWTTYQSLQTPEQPPLSSASISYLNLSPVLISLVGTLAAMIFYGLVLYVAGRMLLAPPSRERSAEKESEESDIVIMPLEAASSQREPRS